MIRKYYSQRKNKSIEGIDRSTLEKIFLSIYDDFDKRGYFQYHFGINCTDGYVAGLIGYDINGYVLRKLRKVDMYPPSEALMFGTEEDLFDLIEFFFDHIAKPTDGENAYYHQWSQCGYHYQTFDIESAKIEYSSSINEFLNDYKEGYELSQKGEILSLVKEEFSSLITASVPKTVDESIQEKIDLAVTQFRKYGSTLEQRMQAVRELADCLEYLRPKAKTLLTNKDDNEIFQIINNFGIRHHNDKQKTNYDKNIWLSWMFYYYLATIHAITRFKEPIKKNQ